MYLRHRKFIFKDYDLTYFHLLSNNNKRKFIYFKFQHNISSKPDEEDWKIMFFSLSLCVFAVKYGAIWTTPYLLRLSWQISQPQTTAVPAFILHGTMHGRTSWLCTTTGKYLCYIFYMLMRGNFYILKAYMHRI